MAIEKELRFSVDESKWLASLDRNEASNLDLIRQSYLFDIRGYCGRIRSSLMEGYTLTFKSPKVKGSCREYEFKVPSWIGDILLRRTYIRKVRRVIPIEGLPISWEVDEFHGQLKGLIIAELELGDYTGEYTKPDWLGSDITDYKPYYNINLYKRILNNGTTNSLNE